MAGDWIKMRVGLSDDPRVVTLASRCRHAVSVTNLQLRRLVVGALHALWAVADQHSVDGWLAGYRPEDVDELAGVDGFCSGLEAVGWIALEADGVQILDFQRHNGASAKVRAQAARRSATLRGVQLSRSKRDESTPPVTQSSRSQRDERHGECVTKSAPRERVKRENLSPPLPPPPLRSVAAGPEPPPLADPGPALPEDPHGASSSPPRGDTPRTPTRDEGGVPEPAAGSEPGPAPSTRAAPPGEAGHAAGRPAGTSASGAWQQVLDLRAWTARRAAGPRTPAKPQPWVIPVMAEDPCPVCAAEEGCLVGARGGPREHVVAFCRRVERGSEAGEGWISMGSFPTGPQTHAWAWLRRGTPRGALLELCGERPSTAAAPEGAPDRVEIVGEVRALAGELFGAGWEAATWSQPTEVANRSAFLRSWRERDSARARRAS